MIQEIRILPTAACRARRARLAARWVLGNPIMLRNTAETSPLPTCFDTASRVTVGLSDEERQCHAANGLIDPLLACCLSKAVLKLAVLRFDDDLCPRDVAQRGNFAPQWNRLIQKFLDRMPEHDPANDAKTLSQQLIDGVR
jgi:hypothetical protein